MNRGNRHSLDEDLLQRTNQLKEHFTEFAKEVTKSFVQHKVIFIRDFTMISAILLPGLAAFVREESIKTPWLFYIGLSAFAILLVISFAYQRLLFSKEEKLASDLEKHIQSLSASALRYLSNVAQKEHDELNELVDERSAKPTSRQKTPFHRWGETAIFSLFFVGIVFSSVAMLFTLN